MSFPGHFSKVAAHSDIVAESAPAFAQAWGEGGDIPLRWPLFVHAFRKPAVEDAA